MAGSADNERAGGPDLLALSHPETQRVLNSPVPESLHRNRPIQDWQDVPCFSATDAATKAILDVCSSEPVFRHRADVEALLFVSVHLCNLLLLFLNPVNQLEQIANGCADS